MLQINEIWVKKEPKSKCNFARVQEIAEKKLKAAASATTIKSTQTENGLEIVLGNAISFQTANKVLKSISDEGIVIKKVMWRKEKILTLEIGFFEITVS